MGAGTQGKILDRPEPVIFSNGIYSYRGLVEKVWDQVNDSRAE